MPESNILPTRQLDSYAVPALLLFEILLNVVIIEKVPCIARFSPIDTEIDWIAYMQEVGGFLGGEWDYTNLSGDTGPLVYPAGFVYIYSAFAWVTSMGENIYLAQYLFAGIYLVFIWIVFKLYQRAGAGFW